MSQTTAIDALEIGSMRTSAVKLPSLMTVDEFLAWPGDGSGLRYELVDGVLRAQDSASDTHSSIGLELPLAEVYRSTHLGVLP